MRFFILIVSVALVLTAANANFLNNGFGNSGISPKDIKQFKDFQKDLQKAIDTATDPAQKEALSNVKKGVDVIMSPTTTITSTKTGNHDFVVTIGNTSGEEIVTAIVDKNGNIIEANGVPVGPLDLPTKAFNDIKQKANKPQK